MQENGTQCEQSAKYWSFQNIVFILWSSAGVDQHTTVVFRGF